MPNKHFCQGPDCHTKSTSDRFLKSKGIIRGRYAICDMEYGNNSEYYNHQRSKYFCSLGCEHDWLDAHMDKIEQGQTVPFIRERRFTEGYEKVKADSGYYSYNTIQKIGVDEGYQ